MTLLSTVLVCLLVTVQLVLIGILSWVLRTLHRNLGEPYSDSQTHSKQLSNQVEHSLKMVSSLTERVAQLESLHQQQSDLIETRYLQEKKLNANPTPASYKQAIKLVEMGGNLTDVLSTCQLNHAEASLLIHLRDYRIKQAIEKQGKIFASSHHDYR